MNKNNSKVLVIATSRKTKGGITAVVKAHEKGEQWKAFHCKWIQTQIDSNLFNKIKYLFISYVKFIFLIPFYCIVHIHTVPGRCARLKSPYVFLSKLLQKKIIVHIHVGDQIKKYVNDRYFNYVLKEADIIVVLSSSVKKNLEDLYGLNTKVVVVYNPCIVVDKPFITIKKRQILYAGTLNENKGYADLIKAFSLISKQFTEWKLIFAGNGEIKNAKFLAKKLNIENQVSFLGWVTGSKKDSLFKESSIFCLASKSEGFPMGVLDAWAYGMPVVCTPAGGLADIIVDGENALLFNYGDTETLSLQLKRLIIDERLRLFIAQESQELSLSIFDIDKVNVHISKLYENLSNY